MSDDTKKYDVGYGKPPKSGQFKPGKSPNPKGRPRKAKPSPATQPLTELVSIDRKFLEEADRLVRVRDGEQVLEVSQERAVLRSLLNSAMKGGILAQRTVIEHYQRIQAVEMKRRQELWAQARAYVDRWPALAKHAEERSQPRPLPHPDDIEFTEDGYAVRGPCNAEELQTAMIVVDSRDLFLSLDAYGSYWDKGSSGDGQAIPCWQFASHQMNAGLARSLRLSDEEMASRAWYFYAIGRLKLERYISELCAKLGWPLKLTLRLSRELRVIELRSLGFKLVDGKLVKERGWSWAKVIEQMWAEMSVEGLTRKKLEFLESIDCVGPPSWMARARASIAMREDLNR